jgi:hypothetical protein
MKLYYLHICFVPVDVLVNIINIYKFAWLCDVSMPLMLNKMSIFE